ncbi:4a-hydroxytetrahydrobiopterin dehydratase [candidate division KSB1 bacterium]|nr:4a-hydroxytetrahydrobiopterin dehydratase [candidate division KSB1 bacterium]
MEGLLTLQCEACRIDSPKATDDEIRQFMPLLPDWSIVEINDVKRLQRVFSFRDFRDALAFTNQVGELAESEGHHPAIIIEWGRVTVQWWTHKIHGLHRNDFILAAKTDQLIH